MNIQIYSKEDFRFMYEAGQLARATLDYIEPLITPGITTWDVNKLCHEFITSHGGIPSSLGYRGFPGSVCTSLNNVACHGIPSKKDILKEGDILNVDVVVFFQGKNGDTSRNYLVGNCSDKAKHLIQTVWEAMWVGIKAVKPNINMGVMSAAVETFVQSKGYSVVRDYGGHGIGNKMHESPPVSFYGPANRGPVLKNGMCFTIEPIINQGHRDIFMLNDKWTIVTADGKLSAQSEHSIGITEDSCVVFTMNDKEKPLYPEYCWKE